MQLTPIALVYKTGNLFILTAQCFGELPSPYEAEMPKKKKKKKKQSSRLCFLLSRRLAITFIFTLFYLLLFFFLHFKDNKLFPSL